MSLGNSVSPTLIQRTVYCISRLPKILALVIFHSRPHPSAHRSRMDGIISRPSWILCTIIANSPAVRHSTLPLTISCRLSCRNHWPASHVFRSHIAAPSSIRYLTFLISGPETTYIPRPNRNGGPHRITLSICMQICVILSGINNRCRGYRDMPHARVRRNRSASACRTKARFGSQGRWWHTTRSRC